MCREATFESADLDEIPDNSELRLAPDEMPADGGGEAGGHAAHLLVAFRKVAIMAGCSRCLLRLRNMLSYVPFPKNPQGGSPSQFALGEQIRQPKLGAVYPP